MHVHVHFGPVEADEQHNEGMSIARQIIRIGCPHRSEQQLVATGRPFTSRYWQSELTRESVGSPAKPVTRTASRSASMAIALARKSGPRMSASRSSWPPLSAEGPVSGARSSPASVKETSGRLMAKRG